MIVVVGGGIAGIVSAILLQQKFGEVCLVEQSNKIGGLYRSKKSELGVTFDYGSHFLQSSGIPDLDKIILDGISESSWLELGNLKGGGYYKSKLNSNSAFLDARNLSKEIYERGVIEVLNITKNNPDPLNLEEQLYSFFGKTFTDEIFREILSKKYYGCKLNQLAPNAHGLLGLGRILGFTGEASREIKNSKIYDQKFAFHYSNDYVSNLKNYYPKKGGIQLWIDLLEKKLKSLNVKIITGSKIANISHNNGNVNNLTLENGDKINCSKIIWTVAPILFLKSCNLLNKNDFSQPPKQVYTSLHHFAFDKPFLTNVFYVHCHDPAFKTFRITLYPNIQKNQSSVFHMTAEVIEPVMSDINELRKLVLSELTQIGVVSKESNLLFQESDLLPRGFPLPTNELRNNNMKYMKIAEEKIKNAIFLGRASGNNFTTGPVLSGVFKNINSLK